MKGFRICIVNGYTLIELVVVLLIVSVLAAFAVPHLNISTFREQGFVQQSFAAIRYAQKHAIGSGCNVQVTINSSGCNLGFTGAPAGCPASALINPVSGNANFCLDSDAPSGSTFAAPFAFDKIGRPIGGTQQYDLGGRIIQVEAETGYTHEL